MTNVKVIVGCQYGSEGKGKIANILCKDADVSVRVGGTNAGHTIWYDGKKYAMQTIPVGWTNPDCKLVIGAGALINLGILNREIQMIKDAGFSVDGRLFIDFATGIITSEHQKREEDLKMNLFNGSTCEGVGAATADRVMRILQTASEYPALSPYLADTVFLLNQWANDSREIIIEGTQGLGLSLFTARFNGKLMYPKCSSREVTPSAILADCGLSPKFYTAKGVMRSYPIRVGWQEAGDMLGKELSWEEVTKLSNSPVPLHEITTVTKRTRRVGELNLKWMKEVVDNNDIDDIALTFADYFDYADFGKTTYKSLTTKTKKIIKNIEDTLERPIWLISTGKLPEQTIMRNE